MDKLYWWAGAIWTIVWFFGVTVLWNRLPKKMESTYSYPQGKVDVLTSAIIYYFAGGAAAFLAWPLSIAFTIASYIRSKQKEEPK